MSKPKILIIGCGAVGLSQGYHLSSAADITYLVRPGRRPAFLPPKNLYNYKTNTLSTFSDFRIIESASEVSGEEFTFVLDTLDGFTARSESGAKTLREVGDLIREQKDTFVCYDAVGLDMEEYYAETMRLPKERFIMVVSMLAHQPISLISVPPFANHALVAKADILYVPNSGDVGIMVLKKRAELARNFKEMYEKNGNLKVQIMPGFLEGAMAVVMMHLVAWKADGFQSLEHLRGNTELWSLILKAQNEILSLKRFAWWGWVLSWVLGSWATFKVMKAPAEGASPMDYREFNAFHHGDKVVRQDVKVLRDLVQEGEKEGKKMEALRGILGRVEGMLEAKKTV